MRTSMIRRAGWLPLIALMALATVGCDDKLKAQNEALQLENLELRDQLATEQQARIACDDERNQLLMQIDELQQGTTTATAGTGFGDTYEVERGSKGEIIVRIPGDVLFSSGKADLKSSAKSSLGEIARVINADYPGNTIRIEGYSDSDPIKKSKWKDNLALSAERAMAVHRYLKSKGVDADRMYAAGFGATNYRASNSSSQGKAQNRRVEIVVLMN